MKKEKIIYAKEELSKVTGIEKEIEWNWQTSCKDFRKEKTSYTTKYFSTDHYIEILPGGSELSGYGANFIKQIKDYFAAKQVPERLSDLAPYCEYFKPISTYTEIENVVEIDLNKAYWKAALNLGYLDNKIYQKALNPKINKLDRLVALGVLGKRTEITTFKYPYKELKPIESFPETRPFWNNIVYTIGGVLEETVNHYLPHIHGVWFDALFVDKKVSEPIRQYLLRRGYEASTEAISSYIVTPRTGIREGAEITRVFKNGAVKKMHVSYKTEEEKGMSFEDFIKKVLAEI